MCVYVRGEGKSVSLHICKHLHTYTPNALIQPFSLSVFVFLLNVWIVINVMFNRNLIPDCNDEPISPSSTQLSESCPSGYSAGFSRWLYVSTGVSPSRAGCLQWSLPLHITRCVCVHYCMTVWRTEGCCSDNAEKFMIRAHDEKSSRCEREHQAVTQIQDI